MKKVITTLVFMMSAVMSYGSEIDEIDEIDEINMINKEIPSIPSLTETIEMPILNEYNNRGRLYQNEAVIQPNITVIKATSVGSILVNAWGNMAPSKYSKQGEPTFNEIDLTAGYIYSKADIIYGFGLIEYILSGSNLANTHETYMSVSYASILNPTIVVYYDFKEANGWYCQRKSYV